MQTLSGHVKKLIASTNNKFSLGLLTVYCNKHFIILIFVDPCIII
jgi:hypothetical protein